MTEAGSPSEVAAASSSATSGSPQDLWLPLEDGPVAPGRYVVMPPPLGWSECTEWVEDCAPLPHEHSLRVAITVPAGWEAGMDATVVVPQGLSEGSSEGPGGAGLVMGWTGPYAGLNSDPCLPVPHVTPDIRVGPSVDQFVHAVVSHPSLKVSEPVATQLGGFPGMVFELTGPSDVSGCEAWRPFEGGIYAQGPDNLWRVWVMDVDGLRFILLTEEFPGTPEKVSAELRTMVASIRFLP